MEIGKLRKQIIYSKIGQNTDFLNIKYIDFEDINTYLDSLAQVLESGVKIIQLDGEKLNDVAFLDIARKTKQLCAIYNSTFMVKSRADIAYLSSADGVNLEQDDLDIESVREIIGENILIGIYIESKDIRNLTIADTDYLIVGKSSEHNTQVVKNNQKTVIIEKDYPI